VRLKEKGKSIDYQALYEKVYADEPFVDVLPEGSLPETRMVRGSNMVRIALYRKEPDLLVVEDNLVKGSAGQAVQAMNLVMGLPETEGLEQIALVP
jgi:N-acetyl-gamma-glutamyl-phosphate reductase